MLCANAWRACSRGFQSAQASASSAENPNEAGRPTSTFVSRPATEPEGLEARQFHMARPSAAMGREAVIRLIRRLPEVPVSGGEHPDAEAEVGEAVGQDARLEAPRAVPEQVVRDPRHQPYQPLRVFGGEETRRDQERDPRERPRRDRLEVGPDQPTDQESAPEELLRDRDDEDSSDKAESD